MNNNEIMALDHEYIMATYGRLPIAPMKGKNATMVDADGKTYIDFTSGIGVNSLGYCDDEWVAAVTAQLEKIQHMCNYYYCENAGLVAKQLVLLSGLNKVFFGNSGAEANEGAIKLARKYSYDKYKDGRSTIVSLKSSFHGRTITTLAATGQDVFHTDFGPFTPGFVYADPNDPASIEKLAAEHGCAAIMFETIQGEGGVLELPEETVNAIRNTAKKYGLLIVIDEVQTGNGRTGKLFSYMHHGLEPDIVSTAKGLAGGLPLGATLFGKRTADVYTPGTHGSTFGGNPVCCAAAISVLSRITDDLLADIERKGAYIRSALEGGKGVKSVSGRGLMLGVESERAVADVLADCRARWVLALSAKTKVRLLPPYCITDEQLEKAISILKEVCAK